MPPHQNLWVDSGEEPIFSTVSTPVGNLSRMSRASIAAFTTCHLANFALHVGRPIRWDAQQEQIVDDAKAKAMLRREQRQGYEVA